VCSKETVDLDQSFLPQGLFSTVVQLPYSTNTGISVSTRDSEETGSRKLESEATASKLENASIRDVEEIDIEKDGEQ